MSFITLDLADTLDRLSNGATMITANRHLANHVTRRYDLQHQSSGDSVWHQADILDWSSWINRNLSHCEDLGLTRETILTTPQETLLWEQIIRRDLQDNPLTNYRSAAKNALGANQLLESWQISDDRLDTHDNPETRLFLRWRRHMATLLERNHWLGSSQTVGRLIDLACQIDDLRHASLILAGFQEFTPAQMSLFERLAACGCTITRLREETLQINARLYDAPDPVTEAGHAISWAIEKLRESPHARIAIVAPDLIRQQERLSRLVTEIASPGTLLPGQSTSPPLVSFTPGKSLSEYPGILDALSALRMLHGKHPVSVLGALLRSPFLAGAEEEWIARGILDRELRARGIPEISIHGIAGHADGCPLLGSMLKALGTAIDQLPRYAAPSAWTEHFLQILGILGWPGPRRLDSTEYQYAERFKQAVTELGKFDLIRNSLSFTQAVTLLTQSCEDIRFQPRTVETPILVTGVLEASSMRFDYCWLLGFDDNAWPTSPQPNPLLPLAFQRSSNMPHASPERELQYCQRLSLQLLACAREVIVSYAIRQGDQAGRCSPLFAGLQRDPNLEHDGPPLWKLAEDRALVSVDPDEIPPAGEALTGGTSIIADQSACPFRALARHRLHARQLEEPDYPLDARISGELVHRILEQVWEQLRNRETLLEKPGQQTTTLVRSCIDQCLDFAVKHRPDLFSEPFRELEVERLHKLILAWLEVEKSRPPFRVIERECRTRYLCGPLSIHMRIDRIDELEDGQQMIIDYKTGRRASTSSWTDPRPAEPQLPLYAIANSPAPCALAIAKVHPDKCEFRGLTADRELTPGLEEFHSWPELLEQWKQAINRIGREYLAGVATVTPQPGACEYCELDGLCRIDE